MEGNNYERLMLEDTTPGIEESYYIQESFKVAEYFYNNLTEKEREDWFKMVITPHEKIEKT